MNSDFSRRSFLALTAAAPLARAVPQAPKRLPIGLELYSVRTELAKDLTGTVTAVAKMGYEVVEFFSPYYQWTTDQAKDVRKLMDGLGIRCNSTHNDYGNLGAGLPKAIELNNILGTKYIVCASAGNPRGVDGWKGVAATLSSAAAATKAAGLRVGYHNHQTEFTPLPDGGPMPIQVLAANTPPEVMLQFDVGTCVQMGYDPVKWIEENPGRINSLHLKEWGAGTGPERGYRTLIGEGDVPWLRIFAAAEKTGGVEYYLIEQEGSRFPQLETAQRCLDNYKKLRGYA
jgi:sugar phosphate isomerase/epimerase